MVTRDPCLMFRDFLSWYVFVRLANECSLLERLVAIQSLDSPLWSWMPP